MKGFTLIELLAVIVILAIIALIATPIVLSIIEDTKSSSLLRSAEYYLSAVEQSIMKESLIAGESFSPKKCEIQSNGDLLCDEKYTLEIKVKGEKPNDGHIIFNSNKINQVLLMLGNKIITKGEEEHLIFIPVPKSFAEDSWDVIKANVKAGNLDAYKVGDKKEVLLTGELSGKYVVRIANTSTPDECNSIGFSQTACGFVVEFEGVITHKAINSPSTNIGGWKSSQLREYVNSELYSLLPKELQENIINTYVVSGHGSTAGEGNFETIDKLYLLSTKEVYGETGKDASEDQTRQLDYYTKSGVILNKSHDGSNHAPWWLRTSDINKTTHFCCVYANAVLISSYSGDAYGVSVAFRIG